MCHDTIQMCHKQRCQTFSGANCIPHNWMRPGFPAIHGLPLNALKDCRAELHFGANTFTSPAPLSTRRVAGAAVMPQKGFLLELHHHFARFVWSGLVVGTRVRMPSNPLRSQQTLPFHRPAALPQSKTSRTSQAMKEGILLGNGFRRNVLVILGCEAEMLSTQWRRQAERHAPGIRLASEFPATFFHLSASDCTGSCFLGWMLRHFLDAEVL